MQTSSNKLYDLKLYTQEEKKVWFNFLEKLDNHFQQKAGEQPKPKSIAGKHKCLKNAIVPIY